MMHCDPGNSYYLQPNRTVIAVCLTNLSWVHREFAALNCFHKSELLQLAGLGGRKGGDETPEARSLI